MKYRFFIWLIAICAQAFMLLALFVLVHENERLRNDLVDRNLEIRKIESAVNRLDMRVRYAEYWCLGTDA